MSLKNSIPYSKFLRLKGKHFEPQHLLEAQIYTYLLFIWRENPKELIERKWQQASGMSWEQLLIAKETTNDTKTLLMFITTYSRSNPNFKEIISRHWSYLGRSSAIRELGKQDFITYRKPPFFQDLLVRPKIPQPYIPHQKGCKIPHNCKSCKISQLGYIKT